MDRSRLRSEFRLFRKYAPASDLFLAIIFFGGVTTLALAKPKLQDPHLLDVSTGVGVAILAVVIAAISILSAFLTEDYGVMLRKVYPDVGEVFYPYKLIAATSGITVVVSGVGLFLWPSLWSGARATILGAAIGLAAWSIIGAVHLVGITATHGRMKLRLPELRESYQRGRAEAASSEEETSIE